MNANEYLKNLGQWQASSHPELAERKPEELFEAPFAERYKRLHENLWFRISRVHGTLCTIEQLEQFPFDYLYGPMDMEFWRLITDNFIDIVILMLDGLVNDKGNDVHTILWFHDDIMRGPWLCKEKRELLQQTLKERKFDDSIEIIAKRVKEIRDNFIAHQLIDRQSGSPKEAIAGVSLKELRQLFDAVHSLFGALSFGSAYCTLSGDMIPGTIGGKPTRTCLDKVLDAVLRDSFFVNQPELRKEWWFIDRQCMTAEKIQLMNDLRKRIGLPEA